MNSSTSTMQKNRNDKEKDKDKDKEKENDLLIISNCDINEKLHLKSKFSLISYKLFDIKR